MNTFRYVASALALGLLVACGGGKTPDPPKATAPSTAARLVYTAPASGTYKLVRNEALSRDTHLVLDLAGPAGATGSGFALFMSLDSSKATWSKVQDSDTAMVQNGGVLDLGTTLPQILKASVSSDGSQIQAVVSEKGNAAAKPLNGTLLRVALDLKASTALTVGTSIDLKADAMRCQVLLPAGGASSLQTVTVSTGTLVAQ